MRIFTLLLFTMILASCHSQSGKKKYYFGSVGWTIWVADTLTVEDSAKYHRFDNAKPPEYKYDPANPPDSFVAPPGQERSSSSTTTAEYQRYVPVKLLIRIPYPNGRWNLNAAYLSATIKDINTVPEGFEQYLKKTRPEMVTMLTTAFNGPSKVDTSSSIEKFSGRTFYKTEYVLHYDKSASKHLISYTAVINNYLYEAGIWYTNEDDGKALMKIWNASSFKK